MQVWRFSANFAELKERKRNQKITMSEHFQQLVAFYVHRISAMEAALKAATDERDALLRERMEQQGS